MTVIWYHHFEVRSEIIVTFKFPRRSRLGHLDYGEEVHPSVKNIPPKIRLFEATVGMANKMRKNKNKMLQIGVHRMSSLLYEGFEIAQET